jgi:peptide/nickel transport system ATP-binding protein
MLLSVDALKVAYPTIRSSNASPWALEDISFSLQPGERLGLVGESGCGKSTLGKTILRMLPQGSTTTGQMLIEGRSILDMSPDQLRRYRGEAVGLVFQDPMTRLNPLMTIGNHCLETLKAHRPGMSTRQAKTRAMEVLGQVKIPEARWNQYPHEFSGGMRQRVAIALALLLQPKLIVADEPTTSLDVTVSAEILDELTRLCSEKQVGLIIISHDLPMIGEYCDRIAVMYQGRMVELGSTQQVFTAPQHPYTRQLLNSALHLQQAALDHDTSGVSNSGSNSGSTAGSNAGSTAGSNAGPTMPILRLTEVKQHYSLGTNPIQRLFSGSSNLIKAVDGINFELLPGETLGLVGESGCGKSTLSRTILQLLKPTGGTVEFLGQDLASLPKRTLRRRRRQMQMIFQDPHACLNPLMTIGESIADPILIHKMGSAADARREVIWMLERVGLTPVEDYLDRYPNQLSGGQQQRVAIARALITRPKLVICDEPVSMLDATVQSQVLDLMMELKQEFGLTYLFITHDLWVARYFCDRIAIMQGGKIVEIGPTQKLFMHPEHPYTQKLLGAAPLMARA